MSYCYTAFADTVVAGSLSNSFLCKALWDAWRIKGARQPPSFIQNPFCFPSWVYPLKNQSGFALTGAFACWKHLCRLCFERFQTPSCCDSHILHFITFKMRQELLKHTKKQRKKRNEISSCTWLSLLPFFFFLVKYHLRKKEREKTKAGGGGGDKEVWKGKK